MGKIKLFGFELTMTSALLLFIFAMGLVFLGVFGMYQTITSFQATDIFPTAMFFIYLLLTMVGLYILIQTVRFRR